MNKVFEWMTKKENMRNTRTILIASLVIIIPFAYFGLFDQIDLNTLLTVGVGTSSLMAIILLWVWKFEVTKRAEEDEYNDNEAWRTYEDEIVKETTAIKNHKEANNYIKKYNEDQQNYFNSLKTDDKIKKLEYKKIKRIAKDKNVDKIETRIKKLKTYPLHNNVYKPLKSGDILISGNNKVKKDVNGRELFVYNYKTDGIVWELFTSIVKMFSIGGSIMSHYVFSTDWRMIITYYVFLILALALTTVFKYSSIRIKIKENYIPVRINKLRFLKEMNKSIDNSNIVEIKKEDTN